MKKTMLLTAGLAILMLGPVAALAGGKDQGAREPWIHVQVQERGGEKESVNVNVPFALADAALASLGDDIGTHIRLGEHGRHARVTEGEAGDQGEGGEGIDSGEHGDHPDISVADMRRMWKAMRDAGEADYVTVTSDNENVHIWREGDLVRVDVDSREKGRENQGEKVRIRVPVGVMDALLSGEGDQLDVRAAVNSLKEIKSGEVIRVEDGEDLVRVWIDDSPEAGGI